MSRSWIQWFYEGCRNRLGSNSRYIGLGDTVGFLGPFYCAACLFFLLEIILFIAGKKKKAAAVFGAICGFLTLICLGLFEFAWLLPSNGYFFSSSYKIGHVMTIGLAILAIALLIACLVRAAKAPSAQKSSAAASDELEHLRQQIAEMSRQMEALKQNKELPQETASVQEPSAAAPVPEQKKSGGRIIALVLLFVLLLGGGFAAAKFYFIPNSQYEQAVSTYDRVHQDSYSVVKFSAAELADLGERYGRAAEQLESLGHFKDADELARLAREQQKTMISRAEEAKRQEEELPARTAQWMGSISDGMIRFETAQGKNGFLDSDGHVVIPPIYDSAEAFDDGYSDVKMNNLYGVIDKKGNLVLPCEWDEIYDSGLTDVWTVKKGDIYRLIRKDGTFLGAEFANNPTFSEGLVSVKGKGFNGYLNEAGEMAISVPDTWSCYRFKNGKAQVLIEENGQQTYGFINTEGKLISSFVLDKKYRYPYYDDESGYFFATKRVGARETVVKLDASSGSEVAESRYLNTQNSKTSFDALEVLSWNMPSEDRLPAMMWQDDKHITGGIYTKTQTMIYLDSGLLGLIIFPPDGIAWMTAGPFENGKAIVQTCGTDKLGHLDYDKKGYYGVIDKSGKYIIKAQYDQISYRSRDDQFAVKKGDVWGLLDGSGRTIMVPKYNSIGWFYADRSLVRQGSRYGYIDKSGNLVIACTCEDAKAFDKETQRATVKVNGQWHIIDAFGNIIW